MQVTVYLKVVRTVQMIDLKVILNASTNKRNIFRHQHQVMNKFSSPWEADVSCVSFSSEHSFYSLFLCNIFALLNFVAEHERI